MDNQKNLTAEQPMEENTTVSETVSESAEQPTQEAPARRKVYKDQDFYPVCAIIICICFAIGHLIGSLIFQDPRSGSSVGMIIGIIAAIVYISKGGKQIDTSPTKPKQKKEKKK